MTSIEHLNGRSELFSMAPTDASAQSLPVLVQGTSGQSIHDLDTSIRDSLAHLLSTVGGVLFRGFTVATPIDFKRFAASFGAPLASYEFGSTPRSKVFAGVYSSTSIRPINSSRCTTNRPTPVPGLRASGSTASRPVKPAARPRLPIAA